RRLRYRRNRIARPIWFSPLRFREAKTSDCDMKRFLPWIILAVVAGWIGASWLPPKRGADDVDLAKFGKIPVQVGGRVKPLDTVARNSLLIMHGKQELRLEGGPAGAGSAMQWLTDVLFNAPVADKYPVFVVQNAEVLGLFGWEQ